jgi:hypothetical protein
MTCIFQTMCINDLWRISTMLIGLVKCPLSEPSLRCIGIDKIACIFDAE